MTSYTAAMIESTDATSAGFAAGGAGFSLVNGFGVVEGVGIGVVDCFSCAGVTATVRNINARARRYLDENEISFMWLSWKVIDV